MLDSPSRSHASCGPRSSANLLMRLRDCQAKSTLKTLACPSLSLFLLLAFQLFVYFPFSLFFFRLDKLSTDTHVPKSTKYIPAYSHLHARGRETIVHYAIFSHLSFSISTCFRYFNILLRRKALVDMAGLKIARQLY